MSMDKTIAIRIDAALHRLVKTRCAESKASLKDYIVGLIWSDLKDRKHLVMDFEGVSVEGIISEDSVREAQKVVDYVRLILASRRE